jgi:hypothetical protein
MEFSIFIQRDGNNRNVIEMQAKGMLFGHIFLLSCMNTLTQTPTI